MRKTCVLAAVAAVLTLAGCEQADRGPWFSGDMEAAKAAAAARDTLIVMDFYSDT
jgi:hypothetical protein